MSDVIKDLSELRLSYEQGELHEGRLNLILISSFWVGLTML